MSLVEREITRNLSRIGRFYCDRLPTALKLVDLRYRPAYYADAGYVLEFKYQVFNLIRVFGLNVGANPPSDEQLLEIQEVVLDAARNDCLAEYRENTQSRLVLPPSCTSVKSVGRR